MAKHEFGIMGTAPIRGKRYDEYEPENMAVSLLTMIT